MVSKALNGEEILLTEKLEKLSSNCAAPGHKASKCSTDEHFLVEIAVELSSSQGVKTK